MAKTDTPDPLETGEKLINLSSLGGALRDNRLEVVQIATNEGCKALRRTLNQRLIPVLGAGDPNNIPTNKPNSEPEQVDPKQRIRELAQQFHSLVRVDPKTGKRVLTIVMSKLDTMAGERIREEDGGDPEKLGLLAPAITRVMSLITSDGRDPQSFAMQRKSWWSIARIMHKTNVPTLEHVFDPVFDELRKQGFNVVVDLRSNPQGIPLRAYVTKEITF